MIKNVKIVIFRLYQKNSPTIYLILHLFNLYVLLFVKKIGDD